MRVALLAFALCIAVVRSFQSIRPLCMVKNMRPVHTGVSHRGTCHIGRNLQAAPSHFFREAAVVHSTLGTLLALSNQKSLTREGLVHATALGLGLWTFLGWRGWLVCVTYLILGSIVTKVKLLEKQKLGIAESRDGARGPENVWGSAATAMICAFLSYALPEHAGLFRTGYVAALSTKLSDTFASELGKAYGRNTYLITSLRRVPKGTEGAVSAEGTLAGIAGSLLIAGSASMLGVISPGAGSIGICVLAALVATTAESYIGAVYQNERHPWLSNETVNFVMTVIGAGLAIAGGAAVGRAGGKTTAS